MAEPNRKLPALSIQQVERFQSHVDRRGPDECWPWKLTPDDGGYGLFKYCKKSYRAHRVAYFVATGHDPDQLLVCHTCDNPPCCNPKHLFLGDSKANLQDCQAKGRLNTASGERHRTRTRPDLILKGERVGGSKLTADQVIEIRNRFAAGESQQSLADEFGIGRGGIKGVTLGRSWKHVGGPIAKSTHERQGRKGENNTFAVLDEDKVREIRHRYASGESNLSLSKLYGVTSCAIAFIVKRRTWKHVA